MPSLSACCSALCTSIGALIPRPGADLATVTLATQDYLRNTSASGRHDFIEGTGLRAIQVLEVLKKGMETYPAIAETYAELAARIGEEITLPHSVPRHVAETAINAAQRGQQATEQREWFLRADTQLRASELLKQPELLVRNSETEAVLLALKATRGVGGKRVEQQLSQLEERFIRDAAIPEVAASAAADIFAEAVEELAVEIAADVMPQQRAAASADAHAVLDV